MYFKELILHHEMYYDGVYYKENEFAEHFPLQAITTSATLNLSNCTPKDFQDILAALISTDRRYTLKLEKAFGELSLTLPIILMDAFLEWLYEEQESDLFSHYTDRYIFSSYPKVHQRNKENCLHNFNLLKEKHNQVSW